MREFDRLARAFLAEHPDGVIIDSCTIVLERQQGELPCALGR
jgi:hypothetical protein